MKLGNIRRLETYDSIVPLYNSNLSTIDSLNLVIEYQEEQINDLRHVVLLKTSIINTLKAQKYNWEAEDKRLNKALRKARSPLSLGISGGVGMTPTSFTPYLGFGLNISLFKIGF